MRQEGGGRQAEGGAAVQVLDSSGMMEDPPWLTGHDDAAVFGSSPPGLPEASANGAGPAGFGRPDADAADEALVPRSTNDETMSRLEEVQTQLGMPLLYTCARPHRPLAAAAGGVVVQAQ